MHHKKTGASKRAAMRNAPEEDPEFQIAPMIDILLVLLVFFMSISSTEVMQSNRAINLPVAQEAKKAKENPGQVIINISWVPLNNMGSIDVNERPYASATEIVPVLQEAVRKVPQTRVLIRADRTVRYDYMRQVLKAVGEAGISNVTFSVVNQDVPK